MADIPNFSKLIPGFDFLQNLAQGTGAGVPNMGQWVAPTLNPEELEKRINELRTVQFWLEQNVRLIGATIQALEVQRMTLSTLQTMNVQMGDLRDALTIKLPPRAAAGSPASAPRPTPPAPAASAATPGAPSATGAGVQQVDPMLWWGALTKQFTQLAASALNDGVAPRDGVTADDAPKPSAPGGATAPAKAPRKRPPPGKTVR